MDKQIKERGIIFNGEMVRSILDGRKTQTRRILSPRQLKMIDTASSIGECYALDCGLQDENSQSYYREWCPFGKVGDRLWVRETFACFDADWIFPGRPHDLKDGPWENVVYSATEAKIPRGTKRPSIHMPRWASRIMLEITDIRVERLNDISEEDAKAEGAPTECCVIGDKHFLGFRSLWKSIYGQDSWQSNPFVWVVEFKRVEAP